MKTFELEYLGFGTHPSKCNVHIKVVDEIHHICFEDIGIGTSVTNASETIASKIINQLRIFPQKCKFFETYGKHKETTFEEIEYTWKIENGKIIASDPSWKPSKIGHIIFKLNM